MRYTLAILSHGDARTLRRTVESYAENVSPAPRSVRVFCDAMPPDVYRRTIDTVREAFTNGVTEDVEFSATALPRQSGFCEATRRLWDATVADARSDFAFWLEHDFVFLRPVDLIALADTLILNPGLAQMSLIRDAANEQEAKAGGLVASRPGEFHPQTTVTPEGEVAWLEHRSYFTTTPSLMRRQFMREHPFLNDGLPHCEGRYGLGLVAMGFQFGAWGDGSEWVGHMGVRDDAGIGY